MKLPLKTKRWDEPRESDDGLRVLITRYRPRALPKEDETWDVWWKDLGPSPGLLKAFQSGLEWNEYRVRYLEEMKSQGEKVGSLARHVAGGQPLTLLCSRFCVEPLRCHRTLLEKLVRDAARGRR